MGWSGDAHPSAQSSLRQQSASPLTKTNPLNEFDSLPLGKMKPLSKALVYRALSYGIAGAITLRFGMIIVGHSSQIVTD